MTSLMNDPFRLYLSIQRPSQISIVVLMGLTFFFNQVTKQREKEERERDRERDGRERVCEIVRERQRFLEEERGEKGGEADT